MTGEARTPDRDEGPLDGITVVDCSQVLVGPFCTMQLGDLGADVIKVEHPDYGDQTRAWAPPTYGDSDVAAYYLSVNRNKRSIALDLKTDEGRDALRRLVADADVLVENFRVGTMEEWGLGYGDLAEDNPDLIYAKLSGYGEWGPARDRPAYDLVMQAEGGFMSITGQEDGPPVRVGVAIADIGAGMYATQAILAALFAREFGDAGGQKIDVSLLDGQVAWTSYMATFYFATGDPPGRMGSKHPSIAAYQAFPTADGYVVVAAASQRLWERLCLALDREELLDDDRFETNEDRVENREELDKILESATRSYDTAELAALLDEAGVPASPVRDMAEVFDNEQVQAREMVASVDHPTVGEVNAPGSPMHFSGTPTTVRRHPPEHGEHTDEILREAGYDDEAIEELRSVGAISDCDTGEPEK